VCCFCLFVFVGSFADEYACVCNWLQPQRTKSEYLLTSHRLHPDEILETSYRCMATDACCLHPTVLRTTPPLPRHRRGLASAWRYMTSLWSAQLRFLRLPLRSTRSIAPADTAAIIAAWMSTVSPAIVLIVSYIETTVTALRVRPTSPSPWRTPSPSFGRRSASGTAGLVTAGSPFTPIGGCVALTAASGVTTPPITGAAFPYTITPASRSRSGNTIPALATSILRAIPIRGMAAPRRPTSRSAPKRSPMSGPTAAPPLPPPLSLLRITLRRSSRATGVTSVSKSQRFPPRFPQILQLLCLPESETPVRATHQ
jgi:hypothetical protein